MLSTSFLVISSLLLANINADISLLPKPEGGLTSVTPPSDLPSSEPPSTVAPLIDSQTPKPEPDTLTALGIPYELWLCGNNDFSRSFSALQVIEYCPTVGVDFNHCCAVHDDCYTNQRGRDYCDNNFCDCLKDIKRNHRNVGTCDGKEEDACDAVKFMGGFAYSASAGLNLPLPPLPIEQRQLPSIEKIAADYANLYEECPYQNVTFTSCALNYNVCVKRSPRNCELGLLRCVEDSRFDRNESTRCDKAVDKVILQMLEPVQIDVSMNVLNAEAQNITIFQKVYRKMSRPINPVFVFVLAAAFFLHLCILGLIICIRCAGQVIFPDEPTVVVPVQASQFSTASQSSSRTY